MQCAIEIINLIDYLLSDIHAKDNGINNNNNVSEAAREAGAAAELAAICKEVKYADIVARHMFEPIAVETLGVFNASAVRLLNDLGRRISSISGDIRETSRLYQRVSVLVQRFNAVLLHDSLPVPDCRD